MTRLWSRMGEVYGGMWVNQFGDVGGSAWATWCKGMASMTANDIAKGVNHIIEQKPKFPPNLPEFMGLCGQDWEETLGLPGKEFLFPSLMNIACKPAQFGESKDLSSLNPAMYWIYSNIDIFNWRQMNCKDARKVFDVMYDKCIEAAKSGVEFAEAPLQIETEDQQREREYKAKRNDPAYMSKRKQAGISALAEMRRGLA